MHIVYTSDFEDLEIHKNDKEQYTDLKFASIIILWLTMQS